ncbi:gephyrin-like molybdotransferase Glp [Paenarthrobacter sp. TA1.8]|uniref:molybdopterin molybdotransferase MoeA n=1 Tax=Paenarthrobacter sp. TA1.8 TaxID=3400219 RepID=UPI003B42BCEC
MQSNEKQLTPLVHNGPSPRTIEKQPTTEENRNVSRHVRAVRDVLQPLLSTPRHERVPVMDALGRGLAETILAPMDLPPFDNSQMDGFAVRSQDLTDGHGALRVGAPGPAGAVPEPLVPGVAAPIMTGAMMPAGANAVIPIEWAVPHIFPPPGALATVTLPSTAAGSFVRRRGSDVAEGDCVLAFGTHLGPRQLGLLSALGVTEVTVHQKVTVLLVTTGDEVVEPGDRRAPGKIYDANNTLLEASMREAGLDVVRAGIIRDEPGVLSELLKQHASHVDLIVTTGGVSKGAYEVVRQTMLDHPVEFSHVEIQPGGPQGLGTFDGIPILAFPGNPVSCLISFEMFLRPLLGELFGTPKPRATYRTQLSHALTSPPRKHQVRRGVLLQNGTVRLEGGEGSHLLGALARSHVLVHIPAGVSELAEGEEVEVWVI